MSQKYQQRLFWSVSRPLKYLGLTVDEWCVSITGVLPGLYFLNSANLKLGGLFIMGGAVLCYLFKKYKYHAQSFKVKSFLIAKGLFNAPAHYPKLLKKEKIGR